jgi:tetratricopeptide (TPR) repeat protein
VPEGCPSESTLEAFAENVLSSPGREAVATHVTTCPHCAGKIGNVVAQVSLTGPTQFDSPAAFRRRITGPSNPSLPAVPPPTDDGTGDTLMTSGERPAVHPTLANLGKGSTLNRYIVLERLGKGGMGEVYAAFDPDLDRKVAVKLLRSDFAATGAQDELRVRMLREAQAMAKLSHPNVVTVHDVGLIGDHVFIAMEFVEGRTVTEWLRARPRSWMQILDIFINAGRGLAAAHAAGITHRDFKPDNVVVSKSGRVRVLDFGLAHAQAPATPQTKADNPESDPGPGAMKRRITQPGTILGTPAYMAPEQLMGHATDQRSDQFSFCASLYEGLYGERPFAGETAPALLAEVLKNNVRPAPKDSLVPGRIRRLLLRGLRAEPAERYRSMTALLIGLSRRRAAVVQQWIAIAAALVVALTGTAFYVQHTRSVQRCADAADRFKGVWDGATKDAAQKAFLATGKPWAKKAWDEAALSLDAYTQRWSRLRLEACEDAPAADERLGQKLLCLARAHTEASAVAQLFTRADADVVEHAAATVYGLPALDACEAPIVAPAASAAVPEEPDSASQTLAEARALIDAGKYADARKKLEPLTETSARAVFLDAIALTRLAELEAAEARLEQAVLLAEATRADEILARAWTERVGVAAVRAETTEAARWARFARAALDRLHASDELEASYQNSLGLLAWARADYGAAIDAHTRALVIRQRVLGAQHPLVARSLMNLGAALKAAGRTQEAIDRYREALALEERVLDASHPAVGETLNNLGNALADTGDRTEAITALQRSLDIKERAFGPQSAAVGVALTNLGVLLLKDGQLDAAHEKLVRSLQIKETHAGLEALTTALTLSNLAVLELKRGQPADALFASERAVKIRRVKLGKEAPELANDLLTQGQALLDLGRKKDAIVPLQELVAFAGADASLRKEGEALLAKAKAKR